MSRGVVFMALVLGLTPWGMGFVVQWLHPGLGFAESWRLVGVVTMCLWTPSCVLVGLMAAQWAAKKR